MTNTVKIFDDAAHPSPDPLEMEAIGFADDDDFNRPKSVLISEKRLEENLDELESEDEAEEEEDGSNNDCDNEVTKTRETATILIPATSKANKCAEFKGEPSFTITDKELNDKKEITTCMASICKKEGMRYEEHWVNYFVAQARSKEEPVYESQIQAWVSGIKQERATGAVHQLQDLVASLTIQVQRLTGQVKSLTDHCTSLSEADRVLFDKLEKLNAVTQVETEKKTYVPKAKGKTAEKNALDEKTKKKLAQSFLASINVSHTELEDPRLLSATLKLFTPEQMTLAVTHSISEEEQETVILMIKKELRNSCSTSS